MEKIKLLFYDIDSVGVPGGSDEPEWIAGQWEYHKRRDYQ